MITNQPIPFGPLFVNKKEYWLTLEPDNSICICDQTGDEIQDVALRYLITAEAIHCGKATDLVMERISKIFQGTPR